jgi:next-to-BRCA1 protein 1
MRNICDEVALHLQRMFHFLERILQPRQHGIERIRQLTHFVGRTRVHHAAGESFTKTWEFQNSGTCEWNKDYQLTFVSGSEMHGETAEIDQDVSSGSVADLSVSMIAPASEGTYTGYWRLADEDGNVFGQSVYVLVVVSDEAATLTPTTTPTATARSTSAPTATPTQTSAPISIATSYE